MSFPFLAQNRGVVDGVAPAEIPHSTIDRRGCGGGYDVGGVMLPVKITVGCTTKAIKIDTSREEG